MSQLLTITYHKDVSFIHLFSHSFVQVLAWVTVVITADCIAHREISVFFVQGNSRPELHVRAKWRVLHQDFHWNDHGKGNLDFAIEL